MKVSLKSCSNRINKFAREYKLSGNDKEACSLILMMDLLEENGTAVGVLKEGVFFNKNYKDLRKCLVENFNVREIISVPQDQFENTSTKTSIIIFDNTTEKTSNITFSEIIVEKYTEDKFIDINNEIFLIENKGDISGISDKIISTASKDELLLNPICSFNGKDYNKKEIICSKDYELKKLGSICEFLPKSKRKASDGSDNGKYNFYTSSDKVQKCDFVDYTDECLIIGSGGVPNIKLDSNFSCSADNFIIKTKYNNYIYNFIKGNMYLLNDGFTGSTLKHISKEYLANIKIPIPKSPEKITEWTDKISKVYNKINKHSNRITSLENDIKNKIKNITDNEDCVEVELGSICSINPENLKKNQFSFINYIEISSVKEGIINNITYLKNNYPSRAQRIIKKNDIIFSTVRPNLKGYAFINENIINGVVTSGFAVIRSNNINSKYIYYLLISDDVINYLINNSTGTNYPAVNPSIFNNIKLKIPKDKKLISDLQPLFDEIETLQTKVKDYNSLYEQYIIDLSNDAIPNNNNNNINYTDTQNNSDKSEIITIESENTIKSDEYIKEKKKYIKKNKK